ncbi:uncharacterized protein LOC103514361, partial [Diaphorina citri]|uniref:Uncharacterized protein LOC103514361 n=1 Tax=Diaphorina citri TaxID=121845 RepID=A0A3Q0J8V7_DIACI
LFKTHSPFSKPLIFSILHDLTTKTVPKTDESIYDFVSRRFGSEVADYARGVNFLMAKLFELEQLHGGVIKGAIKEMMSKRPDLSGYEESELYRRSRIEKWSVWSVEGGLQTIVNTLGEHLSNKVEVKMDTTCTNLEFLEKGVKVTLNNDQHIEANHVANLEFLEKGVKVTLNNDQHIEANHINTCDSNRPGSYKFHSPSRKQLSSSTLSLYSKSFTECPRLKKAHQMTRRKILESRTTYENQPFGNVSKSTSVKLNRTFLFNNMDGFNRRGPPRIPYDRVLEGIQGYIDTHQLPLYLTGSSYDGVGVNDVIALSKKAVESIKWQHWGAQAG